MASDESPPTRFEMQHVSLLVRELEAFLSEGPSTMTVRWLLRLVGMYAHEPHDPARREILKVRTRAWRQAVPIGTDDVLLEAFENQAWVKEGKALLRDSLVHHGTSGGMPLRGWT